MYQSCPECGRAYNDEIHSTVCPHRGIGFCAVCDCAACVCAPGRSNYERSMNAGAAEWLAKFADERRKGFPSAEDLDRLAEDERAKQETQG